MNEPSEKLVVTKEMIEGGYAISCQVLRGELTKQEAQEEMMARFNLPERSARTARGYWQCYWYLLKGKKIRNTISEQGWRFNLEQIASGGAAPLMTALSTFMEHIIYRNNDGYKEAALHRAHRDFAERLMNFAQFDSASIELEEGVKRAFGDSPEKRAASVGSSPAKPTVQIVLTKIYRRNPYVIVEVLLRANGMCEGCGKPAPFKRPNGLPYLEVHHRQRLADGGDDTVENAIALCPNCHRERHYGASYAEADDE